MNRTLHTLLLATSLTLSAPAQVIDRPATVHLAEAYGLHPMQSQLQLKNMFSTAAEAKARYPYAFARFQQKFGWTDARCMLLSAFDAAWHDAVWQGQGGGQPITGYLVTTTSIVVPEGTYWQTVTAPFSQGTYTGAGTAWTDTNYPTIATQLVIWHEQWQGDAQQRHCLESGTWGWADNFGYIEGTHIEGFRLNGRSKEAPTQRFRSSGIRLWKPGELSYISNIYAYNFRSSGIEMFAPTPIQLGHISAFENVEAGVSCEGCWGGTLDIGYISGDDNGYLVRSIPGNGAEGGGLWNIGALKHENAITGGRVHRDHIVAYFAGQSAVHIGAINCSNAFEAIDAAIVLDPRLTTGSVQTVSLTVGAMKGFNYGVVVQDISLQSAWRSPGSYVGYSFTYTNAGNGTMSSTVPLARVAHPCPTRLGGYPVGGTPDYASCAPVFRYIIQGPPQYTGTVYLDDAVVTPPPVDPPPVDPPAPDTPVLVKDAYKVTSSTYSAALSHAVTVRRIEFTGLKLSAAPNYSALAVPASGTGYIAVKPDGKWTVGGIDATILATATNGTVSEATVAGTTYSKVVITLQQPVTMARLGTFAGAGGALRFTCTNMTWY